MQIAIINGHFIPNEKHKFKFEIASSKNDKNLFSNIDDDDNNGIATKISSSNRLVKNKIWDVRANTNLDYINKNFQSIELVYNLSLIHI